VSAVRRKDWQPSISSVLCSSHFTKECYRRPPGLKKRALLNGDAIPSIFVAHPQHLQPVPTKKRRVLNRTATFTSCSPLNSESDDAQVNPEDQTVQTTETPIITTTTDAMTQTGSRRGRPLISRDLTISKLRRTVKTLKQKLSRLQKKYVTQKNLVQLLQKDNATHCIKFDAIDGILSELVDNQGKNKTRRTNRDYSDEIKTFALTVHYYSPKTYNYLRSKFILPSSRTIRKWLESVDCEPGFLKDVIDTVSAKFPKEKNAFSLVIDSMSIRKRLVVNRSSGLLDGYITIGDDKKLAGEALVFLLVPILGGQRYPIAYFLVEKCDAEIQSRLIQQCLVMTGERGIDIINITCDGCPSNISTLTKLGANLPALPYFTHPILEHFVYVTLDPVHMLKLARNALATLRRLKSSDGMVDYKYIEDLVTFQDSVGLRLANKLSKRHLKWHNMKMKVRLAAQTLSSSVADALDYLAATDVNFKDSGPTVVFIRMVCTT
jgi:hypothetical protein